MRGFGRRRKSEQATPGRSAGRGPGAIFPCFLLFKKIKIQPCINKNFIHPETLKEQYSTSVCPQRDVRIINIWPHSLYFSFSMYAFNFYCSGEGRVGRGTVAGQHRKWCFREESAGAPFGPGTGSGAAVWDQPCGLSVCHLLCQVLCTCLYINQSVSIYASDSMTFPLCACVFLSGSV